jgi:hypothetical protein
MLKTRPAMRSLLGLNATLALLALLALLVLLAACASGGTATTPAPSATPATTAAPAPPPVAGDVERTEFAPSLGVKLSDMTRRTSGLYVQDLAVGTGAVAASGRTVVVRYSGWLPNGKQVDAGEISVALGANKVIRAWEEGLLGMRAGGKRLLVVPPHLGYGARGAGNDIPPNAVLVFSMQVQSVF